MISDEMLMLEFRAGSREAFEELFARYRELLYGFFRRRVDSRERAEDLTQETFLGVIRGAMRYEPRSTVRSWLFGIAWKLLAADRRRRGRETLGFDDPAASRGSGDGLWVREALTRLEPADRDILMLREYEQLSYSEIAALLRMPLNTVRSRLFRARMALREQLEAKPADRAESGPGSGV
jgi:RNA polymerase sigma-70 factor, ECF subfamily